MNSSNERLVTFLYILLRDDLTIGRINQILKDHVGKLDPLANATFSSPFLEILAREMADRLSA